MSQVACIIDRRGWFLRSKGINQRAQEARADVQVTLADCDDLLSNLAGVDLDLGGLSELCPSLHLRAGSVAPCTTAHRPILVLLEGRRMLDLLLEGVNRGGAEGVLDDIIEDAMQDMRGDRR